jgi:hypothetical protein
MGLSNKGSSSLSRQSQTAHTYTCVVDSSQVFHVIIEQAITACDRTSSGVNGRVVMEDHQESCLYNIEKHAEKLSTLYMGLYC